MRTFVFNLVLFFVSIILCVMLLRPMVAAFRMVSRSEVPTTQPSVNIDPQSPAIEYGNGYDTDYLMIDPALQEQQPIPTL